MSNKKILRKILRKEKNSFFLSRLVLLFFSSCLSSFFDIFSFSHLILRKSFFCATFFFFEKKIGSLTFFCFIFLLSTSFFQRLSVSLRKKFQISFSFSTIFKGEMFLCVFSFILFFSSLENYFCHWKFVFTHFATSFFFTLHFFHPKKKPFQHFPLLECLLCLFISSLRSSSSIHLFSLVFVNPYFLVSFSFLSPLWLCLCFLCLLLSKQKNCILVNLWKTFVFSFSFSPKKLGLVCFHFVLDSFFVYISTFCPFLSVLKQGFLVFFKKKKLSFLGFLFHSSL